MPCRVDLYPVYEYYDQYDRIDYLFFNTPLVPLLCEAMKVIEQNNLTDKIDSEYKEALIKWFNYHKRDDAYFETEGVRLSYRMNEKSLKYFIDLEKKLTRK